MAIRAVLFDVYGTLLDVHGLTGSLQRLFPGQGAALSALWRTKQIDYTRLRTLSGRHADFAQVTADGLDYAAEAMGLTLAPEARRAVLAAYETLPAHPDALPALNQLADQGLRLGVLSNGTPAMIASALAASALAPLLPVQLSIKAAGRYKTAPEAYALGPAAFNLHAGEIGFVSSNGWDAAGAAWFGYRVFWVNRRGEPRERLGIGPEREGSSLADVVDWLAEAKNA